MLDEGRARAGGREGSVTLAAIIQPHADDEIIYDLRPELRDVPFQGVPVSTNSCGMRDRERRLMPEPGTFRIALLGDSFAFGWGVALEESFGAVLERNLNERSDKTRRFEVLNFGVPGYSTFQETALFEDRVADFLPAAVLVFFIDNDFGLPFFVRSVSNPHQLLSSFRVGRLGWSAVAPAGDEDLQRFDPNRALRRLSEQTRARGIPLYLAINPGRSANQMRRQLHVLLDPAVGIRFIDLRKGMLETIERRGLDPATLSLPTDPHPSPLKHQILGDLLTQPFLEYLP